MEHKLTTSRKIRKEIHRLSKLYGYTKEQEQEYLQQLCKNFNFTPRQYAEYLRTFMYRSIVTTKFLTEYEAQQGQLIDEHGSISNVPLFKMAVAIASDYPRLWNNRYW